MTSLLDSKEDLRRQSEFKVKSLSEEVKILTKDNV